MRVRVALAVGLLASAAHAQSDRAGQVPVATLAPLLTEVTPGVVSVSVVGAPEQSAWLQDPALREFFGTPLPQQRRQGIGSGVIVDDAAGLIVTNHHVVQGAESIVITLNDRSTFDATLVGSDAATDIALLEIEAADHALTALSFGDSNELRVGDFVVAIGNPFGLGQTATSGIVSGLGRSGINIEGYEDFIQTDASINPGNSGGALVTLNGELVGINSAIVASTTGGNIGIGFAIPSDMVREIVDQLRQHGEVQRGQLGIGIQDVTQGLAQALDLAVDRGALVSEVQPKSPAEIAGIEIGDVIVAIDGNPIETATELRNAVGLTRLGERVTLTIRRGAEEKTVVADVLMPRAATAPQAPPSPRPAPVAALDGVTVTDLPPDHPLSGEVAGVFIADVAPESFAWLQGLRPNDIVTAVNQEPTGSVAEFTAAVEQSQLPLALHVRRGTRQQFILIE